MNTNLEYLLYTKLNIALSDFFSENGYFDYIEFDSLQLHNYNNNPIKQNVVYASVIGLKTVIMIFVFI